MRNILTDNKSIKKMTNREFINHIFNTSVVHEVILMKIIDDGLKASLSNKDKIFDEWERSKNETKKDFIDSLGCNVPVYFNLIKEIQVAYNLKYKLK